MSLKRKRRPIGRRFLLCLSGSAAAAARTAVAAAARAIAVIGHRNLRSNPCDEAYGAEDASAIGDFPTSGSPFQAQRGSIRTVTRIALARLLLAIALIGAAACGQSPAATLGETPATARANASDFFRALALRFGPLTRSERLKAVRPRYVKGSLVPSRVYGDTTVWTTRSSDVRTLVVGGTTLEDGRYWLEVDGSTPVPARAGDSRHSMHLRALGDGAYEWLSIDELAIGRARAAALDSMRLRFLAAAEGSSPAELRAGWHAALPRTTAALSRLMSVDSLATTTFADGSSLLAMRIAIHPDRVRSVYPDFAAYMKKYVTPTRYTLVVEDYAGRPYATIAQHQDTVRVRLRTRDGILQPLAGPGLSAPADSLRLRADFSAKAMMFRVRAENILGDIVPVRARNERGWMIRWRHEPKWRFPLAVDHLMRASLRRPFAGEGMWMRVVARDVPGSQTLLARDFRMEVEESAIVRWLSRLGNSAMSDVTARVEYQKDKFYADALYALGEDLAGQIR